MVTEILKLACVFIATHRVSLLSNDVLMTYSRSWFFMSGNNLQAGHEPALVSET